MTDMADVLAALVKAAERGQPAGESLVLIVLDNFLAEVADNASRRHASLEVLKHRAESVLPPDADWALALIDQRLTELAVAMAGIDPQPTY